MEKNTVIPRGYRNNNPLNIRRSRGDNYHWRGMRAPDESTDKEFVQFLTMAYGFRAAFCVLRTYIGVHRIKTIPEIIRRWAPDGDGNNSARYTRHVLEISGLRRDYPMDWEYKEHMVRLVYAMATVENGKAPDAYKADIEEGWEMFIKDKAAWARTKGEKEGEL